MDIRNPHQNPVIDEEDPEDEISCPITQQIFLNPVLLVPSGETVEETKAKEMMAKNQGYPYQDIKIKEYVTNLAIKRMVEKYLAKNPGAIERQFKIPKQEEVKDSPPVVAEKAPAAAAQPAQAQPDPNVVREQQAILDAAKEKRARDIQAGKDRGGAAAAPANADKEAADIQKYLEDARKMDAAYGKARQGFGGAAAGQEHGGAAAAPANNEEIQRYLEAQRKIAEIEARYEGQQPADQREHKQAERKEHGGAAAPGVAGKVGIFKSHVHPNFLPVAVALIEKSKSGSEFLFLAGTHFAELKREISTTKKKYKTKGIYLVSYGETPQLLPYSESTATDLYHENKLPVAASPGVYREIIEKLEVEIQNQLSPDNPANKSLGDKFRDMFGRNKK